MLAQSFKTAEQLGIPEDAVEALKKVLVMLETEQIRHHAAFMEPPPSMNPSVVGPIYFNMCSWVINHDCGTVACIGGTAQLISGIDFQLLCHGSRTVTRNLHNLFYPVMAKFHSYDDITTQQAARALRNYLTDGEANWKSALKA